MTVSLTSTIALFDEVVVVFDTHGGAVFKKLFGGGL